MTNMTVTAVNDIKANSYLYMDYSQTEDILYKQFQCGCGTAKCRGWITGRFQRTKPNTINKSIEATLVGIEH
jgi:tyrocidine synthetase-3